MCLIGFIGKVKRWFDDKWIATASGHKEDDKNLVKNLDHYRPFEKGIASAVSAVAAGWPGEPYFMYTCEIEIPGLLKYVRLCNPPPLVLFFLSFR
jgi:hypothetical protein